MESLLESLFSMPTEVLNDWSSLVSSEGSQDPCGVISNSDLKALFTRACNSEFGVSYYAPGINLFFRGDVSVLKSKEKTLVRAYRSESTGKIVLVPCEIATANPCKSFEEMLNRIQVKGRYDSSEPSLN